MIMFENKKHSSMTIIPAINAMIMESREFKGNMGSMRNIVKVCGLKEECEKCATPSWCIGCRRLPDG